ncbi:MAG: heme ABC transporter permease [Gammaproteobacteria bacterium]|nr:MAG: heme ABC transporter permease [Gammaproteobacteria bacterium]
MDWAWFHRLSSPKWFYVLSERWATKLLWSGVLLFVVGVYLSLWATPPDYQQGDSVRIMYLHVPAAMGSMALYMTMAVSAAIGYIWRIRLAYMVAIAIAPVGALLTAVTLITGSLWGRPTWGTWWVWDARLTSELILLFLYLGYIALHRAFEDREVGDRASAVLAMVGVVNVPIIHYSVYWWNTLHQKATITRLGKPLIDSEMGVALYVMMIATGLLVAWICIVRIQTEILDREWRKQWVCELLEKKANVA